MLINIFFNLSILPDIETEKNQNRNFLLMNHATIIWHTSAVFSPIYLTRKQITHMKKPDNVIITVFSVAAGRVSKGTADQGSL